MHPIIDTHIHLYSSSDITNLAWAVDLPQDHCLSKGNNVQEYRAAAKSSSLLGFVFVETDRKSGLDDQEWRHPLEEVEFLARIAKGTPLQGEAFLPSDKDLVLGIIPWAPVPAGALA